MSNLKQNKFLLILILLALAAGVVFFALRDNQVQTSNANLTPTLSGPSTEAVIPPISPDSTLPPNSPPIIPDDENRSGEGNTLPGYELALILAGQMIQLGNYQEAITQYSKAINIHPDQASPYDGRASAYFYLNDYDNALKDYSKAIELDQNFAQTYYNRGRLHSLLKRYDEALSDLQKSIELAPDEFGYRANGNLGLVYHQLGEYQKAIETFDASMSYDNNKADVFFFRGETYTAMENYEAAIADYEAAIDRFSSYDLAYQNLGYAYYKTDQLDQALGALNQATGISPDNPTAHLYMALVHLAMDDLDLAKTEISQAMSLSGNLSTEEQNTAYRGVLTDLESFAREHPDKSEAVKSLVSLIPEIQ